MFPQAAHAVSAADAEVCDLAFDQENMENTRSE